MKKVELFEVPLLAYGDDELCGACIFQCGVPPTLCHPDQKHLPCCILPAAERVS